MRNHGACEAEGRKVRPVLLCYYYKSVEDSERPGVARYACEASPHGGAVKCSFVGGLSQRVCVHVVVADTEDPCPLVGGAQAGELKMAMLAGFTEEDESIEYVIYGHEKST